MVAELSKTVLAVSQVGTLLSVLIYSLMCEFVVVFIIVFVSTVEQYLLSNAFWCVRLVNHQNRQGPWLAYRRSLLSSPRNVR
jgi:hypothetical protein